MEPSPATRNAKSIAYPLSIRWYGYDLHHGVPTYEYEWFAAEHEEDVFFGFYCWLCFGFRRRCYYLFAKSWQATLWCSCSVIMVKKHLTKCEGAHSTALTTATWSEEDKNNMQLHKNCWTLNCFISPTFQDSVANPTLLLSEIQSHLWGDKQSPNKIMLKEVLPCEHLLRDIRMLRCDFDFIACVLDGHSTRQVGYATVARARGAWCSSVPDDGQKLCKPPPGFGDFIGLCIKYVVVATKKCEQSSRRCCHEDISLSFYLLKWKRLVSRLLRTALSLQVILCALLAHVSCQKCEILHSAFRSRANDALKRSTA